MKRLSPGPAPATMTSHFILGAICPLFVTSRWMGGKRIATVLQTPYAPVVAQSVGKSLTS